MADRVRAARALQNLSSLLTPNGLAKAAYASQRGRFLGRLRVLAQAYLDGADRRKTLNAAKRAVIEAYGAVAGDKLWGDDLAFFNSEVDAELDYIESLWGDLTMQKKSGERTLDLSRLELYGKSLDALYAEIKGRADKNRLLEFDGDDGAESCRTCQRLKGQQHRARWWIDKGYIPATPGSTAFECRGFQCQHFLRDVETGERFTFEA